MTTTVPSFRAAAAVINQKMNTFGHGIETANQQGVVAAANAVKGAVASQLGGTSIRMSGVGKKGAKVGVRYDIKGGQNPAALVRMTGPAHLIERDTKAHQIPKPGKRSRGRTRPNVLNIGGRWVTGPVSHPGTKGKHPFARGVGIARPVVRDIYGRAVHRAAIAAFRG